MYAVALNSQPYQNWPSPYSAKACGLGCVECGGMCGMGLFDSGLDWSGWTWKEWAAVFAGAYVAGSVIFTTKRGVSDVRRRVRRARR